MRNKKHIRLFYLGCEPDDYSDPEYLRSKDHHLQIKKDRTQQFRKGIVDLEFLAFVRLLRQYNVPFIVVGSFAVAFYSEERIIGDIDLWIDGKADNLKNLCRALAAFDVPGADQISRQHLSSKNLVIQVGHLADRIDLLIDLRGFDFRQCLSRCNYFYYQKLAFPILGFDDLILSKRLSGREKDMNDIAVLSQTGSKTHLGKKG